MQLTNNMGWMRGQKNGRRVRDKRWQFGFNFNYYLAFERP